MWGGEWQFGFGGSETRPKRGGCGTSATAEGEGGEEVENVKT
jgi:hypothetical protein